MTIVAELNLHAAGEVDVEVYRSLGTVEIEVGGSAHIMLNLAQAKELGRRLYEEGLY